MKYYLIAGEASGDLHASHLMRALKTKDPEAQFRFIGGDDMQKEGGTLLQHYKALAYMGFIPVLLHAGTILRGMRRCRQDIINWQPDVVILVDYPGFNLSIAKFIHTRIPVYYYISPKIWAWKEHRIQSIRKYVDRMFCILPFEVSFYKERGYHVDYVGNPSADEVREFLHQDTSTRADFLQKNGLGDKPIIALLAGSRKQELKDNLRRMIEAAGIFTDYQLIVAGAPGLTPADYTPYIKGKSVRLIFGQTYHLLKYVHTALVTSGTATLETALFNVPQIVCYYTACGKLVSLLRRFLLHVPYVSLVNLIGGKEIVPELVADGMTTANVRRHLKPLLQENSPERLAMLKGYEEIRQELGERNTPENTAALITASLKKEKTSL